MKLKSQLQIIALSTALPFYYAQGSEDHNHHHGKDVNAQEKHGHHGDDHKHSDTKAPETIAEAWGSIQKSMRVIEEAVQTKNLKPIHDAEEKISTSIKVMQEKSTMADADKKKRLEAALKQAATLARHIHEVSDSDDSKKVEAELKKLQGALKLVEAQYPADILKPNP